MSILEAINLIAGFLALVVGIVMFWSLPVPSPQKREYTKLPFISIIIPARNEAERISPLLESLQKQSFQSFEIIVVDDDSTDNTSAIAVEYGAKVVQSRGEFWCWKINGLLDWSKTSQRGVALIP
ncbi:glycosyltransferase [Jeotgalibaca sp. MA1X17-3]|uniref:glycosyltransferase family 2 protein n=1 Tax=Jeotgalibaca sp. MA1X17-3 TaxID=2908211 RepID=UPI002106A699|nr:glycosyltransferase [Jeotgalibaca sp. MA1X17-3]